MESDAERKSTAPKPDVNLYGATVQLTARRMHFDLIHCIAQLQRWPRTLLH
ncbi:hypothetical protein JJE66_17525 [Bradyrhizobium diazoefficiens]|uniref:hypothetical protein n=1 Tax=Bradyrhizobium diazoefficiens TaxID=1355477 RepID=UPI00190DA7CF|nr:hypothetical protein [Bradyrhizobium diazoefficiens]MBK3663013.1 hypothetical protein [Bradyrhizobium diazoefficiens]